MGLVRMGLPRVGVRISSGASIPVPAPLGLMCMGLVRMGLVRGGLVRMGLMWLTR